METKLCEITNNIDGNIPKMEFLVKTQKPGGPQLRNICPKHNACTYYISVILTHIFEDALEKSWQRMQYVDTNIYNSISFVEYLENKTLKEDEQFST